MNLIYKLIFAEGDTGIVLTENGLKANSPSKQYLPRFEKKNEAEEKMESYLNTYPHAECTMINLKSSETKVILSPYFDEYMKEKKQWNKWNYSSKLRRLFFREPRSLYFPNQAEQELNSH